MENGKSCRNIARVEYESDWGLNNSQDHQQTCVDMLLESGNIHAECFNLDMFQTTCDFTEKTYSLDPTIRASLLQIVIYITFRSHFYGKVEPTTETELTNLRTNVVVQRIIWYEDHWNHLKSNGKQIQDTSTFQEIQGNMERFLVLYGTECYKNNVSNIGSTDRS